MTHNKEHSNININNSSFGTPSVIIDQRPVTTEHPQTGDQRFDDYDTNEYIKL